MIRARALSAATAIVLVGSACASDPPLRRQECYNPDAQLAAVLQPFEMLRAKGCVGESPQSGGASCARLRAEIERLLVVCPGHAPTLMANAVIDYDAQQFDKAQQLLDEILALPQIHPDAAGLRARIAIQEGNLSFARRLLDQQIRLSPGDAGLHEIYGAALYLGGQLPEARHELMTAGTLGAPPWRVAYHLGLVGEASGRFDEARRYYAEALEGNPDFAPAGSRMKALGLMDGQQR